MYYVIHFPLTETTIMVPVNNTEELGLRYLSDQKEIKKCFEIIANAQSEIDEDWKIRYKKHQDMLKSGRLSEIAEVIRNLYDRNKVKELSSTEKKLYNNAIDMVVSEIALSLDKNEESVKIEIVRLLDKR
jgi:CarD family transcriptional regulator